jgi:hypothetical protein
MSNFNKKIKNAKTLSDLCELLNSFEEGEDGLDITDCTDLCDLPVFSVNEPNSTMEVFSWDDTHVLIDNSSVLNGDDYELVERCTNCGEADFNCECNH